MIILGIDPGSAITGYGVVRSDKPSDLECLSFGSIRLSRLEQFPERLKKIYDDIFSLIEEYEPDCIALEDIFYSRNIKSALQLGQARGAAILAGINNNKDVATYAPKEVKQALTGSGSASKEQVQMMVMRLLAFDRPIKPLDVSDALAVAICHINRTWTSVRYPQTVI